MNIYNDKITLIKNSRGVYDIDTSKGCFYGLQVNKRGCYGECYAAKFANQYGYNFGESVLRKFESVNQVYDIRKQIFNIDMPFVRIGVSGDPSFNWQHTLNIINLISGIKPIVLITKHWNTLSDSQLNELEKYNVCVNTSISALDSSREILHRLKQYNIIKKHCKSVLRIVSCDFNKANITGLNYSYIQEMLFDNENILDNVFRVSLNNELVKLKIINIEKDLFLTTKAYFSKHNKSTYTGNCFECEEMCGINL